MSSLEQRQNISTTIIMVSSSCENLEECEMRTKMSRGPFRGTTTTSLVRPAAILLLACLFFVVTSSTTASGYESSGSCNPRPSRRGRAQLLAAIPCDLTVQAYCNLPGTAYPWNAVRRFVHENQGLMKRMYGDVRHISVLKTEFENNEIEVDDIEVAAARYSRTGKKREDRKSKYNFSDHSGRLNDVLTEPHFRPTTTSTPSTTTTNRTTTTVENSTVPGISSSEGNSNNSHETKERSSTMSYTDEIENLKNKYELLLDDELENHRDESVESNSIYENTTEGHQPQLPESYNQEKLPESSSTEKSDSKERIQISSTLKIVKVDQVDNDDSGRVSSTIRNVEPIDDLGDMIIVENEGGYRDTTHHDKDDSHDKSTTEKLSSSHSVQPLDRIDDFSAESSEIYTDTKPSTSSVFGEEKHKLQLTPSQPAQQTQGQTMMEGHLYQDSVQKNTQPVMMSGRGVNACPVKEEVVAPFWANNTRGEVLALLNLYPFEQYVHWEKCTNEHKQMYCREGCRCEQQYRLHRLLAYDPHNECRGIFSDWFRFPSCCICKCYDIPNEFRVTSRSPRSPREAAPKRASSSMDEAEQNLHQAIYEHATEDWYRVRRDASDKDPILDSDDWPEEDFDDLLEMN